MDQATHNKIASFIWGIADDVLRDLFKRGKYPDVILPKCDIRRVDAVLEPTKTQVLETRGVLDTARITQQQLLADFGDYLTGFSPNVQDILENFKFRNQLPTFSKADAVADMQPARTAASFRG